MEKMTKEWLIASVSEMFEADSDPATVDELLAHMAVGGSTADREELIAACEMLVFKGELVKTEDGKYAGKPGYWED